MIATVSRVSFTQKNAKRNKTTQKTQNFGAMTYFTKGSIPTSCTPPKETAILSRFARTLSNLIYGEGPSTYHRSTSNTHGLVDEKGLTMFRLEENAGGTKGKHVMEIMSDPEKENTTIFITEDDNNRGILKEIQRGMKKLRQEFGTFTRNDADVAIP